MNTYEPTKSQALAFLESGYCHVDIPQGHARPIEGQNALVCDRTCHVVAVVDQEYSGLMRVYLRRGLK
jgi:hypothetical protein